MGRGAVTADTVERHIQLIGAGHELPGPARHRVPVGNGAVQTHETIRPGHALVVHPVLHHRFGAEAELLRRLGDEHERALQLSLAPAIALATPSSPVTWAS